MHFLLIYSMEMIVTEVCLFIVVTFPLSIIGQNNQESKSAVIGRCKFTQSNSQNIKQ